MVLDDQYGSLYTLERAPKVTFRVRDLSIDLPILQAPMAGSQDFRLAGAISAGGGLGAVPAAMLDAAGLESELRSLTASTTQWSVNFFAHESPVADPVADQRWIDTLRPLYEEAGIDPALAAPGAGRQPFSHALADVLEQFSPALISFHYGLPRQDLLARARATGAAIASTATTVEEAVWLREAGADLIIAQGMEAGGHRGHFLREDLRGQQGLFTLLPQVVAAAGKTPVAAAGGIADSSAVRAALALGAAAVQPGSAFLLCPESTTSSVHRSMLKQARLDPAAAATAITNLFSGRPARGLINELMERLGPMSAVPPAFPRATGPLAALRKHLESQGSGACSPLWCGDRPPAWELPAAEVLRNLADGL